MAKKKKLDIDITPKKVGVARRQEMLEEITNKDTFLPESIMHEDMDSGMLQFVIDTLRVIADGEVIPVMKKIFTLQRWAEFAQTWANVDEDRNMKLPFIAVIRRPDPQPGTNPALQYTIPDRKTFIYTKIPTWDGQQYGATVYKMPQPVPIDIEYEVVIVCDKMRTLNPFNKTVLQKFASRQAYSKIKGHYIPIVLDSISDESQISNVEERKYYQQVYKFRMEGILIDENEFEVKPAMNRAVITTEVTKAKQEREVKSYDGVDVLTIALLADGTKTLFSAGQKIGLLLAVMVNGATQTRDTDYFHNEATSNIIFNTAPGSGKSVTILFITTQTLRIYDGQKKVMLHTDSFTSDATQTYQLMMPVERLLFVEVNGTRNDVFTVNISNQLEINTPTGQTIVAYYLVEEL
jgi:hypothetical protein